MARLPNAEKAIIEPGKLQDYILSSAHPVGRFKAAFFQKLGYSVRNWEAFGAAPEGLDPLQRRVKS